MQLTGKCKEEFEKWFLDNYGFDKWDDVKPNLHTIDPSMRFGVYVDFFKTVDIYPQVQLYPMPSMNKDNEPIQYHSVVETKTNWHSLGFHDDEPDSRNESIEKANELFNEK